MIWSTKTYFEGYKEGFRDGIKLSEEVKKLIRDRAIDDIIKARQEKDVKSYK